VEILKILLVLLMLVLAGVSPILREVFINYAYASGAVVMLGAFFISLRNGRIYEKVWGFGFLSLAIHHSLNLIENLSILPFVGDVFYMLFYLLMFAGNLIHLWESRSTWFLSLVMVLSIASLFGALTAAVSLPAFRDTQVASFFNVFYLLFSAVITFSTLRSALFDRAWILRTLAFGIFTLSEVWFMEWLYLGVNPPDPSVMWLGVVMLAVLSQKPVDRRMRVVRF